MGLNVVSLPLYNGATTINCYANIRDIQQDKTDDGKYSLNCTGMFSVNNTYINCKNLEQISDTVFTNVWADCYVMLKVYLDTLGVSYTDVL